MTIEFVRLPQLYAIFSFSNIEVSTNRSKLMIGRPNGGTHPGINPSVNVANSSLVANLIFLPFNSFLIDLLCSFRDALNKKIANPVSSS